MSLLWSQSSKGSLPKPSGGKGDILPGLLTCGVILSTSCPLPSTPCGRRTGALQEASELPPRVCTWTAPLPLGLCPDFTFTEAFPGSCAFCDGLKSGRAQPAVLIYFSLRHLLQSDIRRILPIARILLPVFFHYSISSWKVGILPVFCCISLHKIGT